jgi:hypothetical protein
MKAAFSPNTNHNKTKHHTAMHMDIEKRAVKMVNRRWFILSDNILKTKIHSTSATMIEKH